MKPKVIYKRRGSLTLIAILFLLFLSGIIVYRYQKVDFQIQNNHIRTAKYQRLTKELNNSKR
ncbi:hypothetical protein EFM02_06435 [Fructilactobacillus fructivorans]|nr:hypothetical protein [Fructilactobacillus fructivorans]MCT2867741.1 hypothetical protein [Fructilactobacillus fructivorans]MCT2868742.1 hypothetical protein [Fructilactobacillus fructivorans]MCT2874088.1 hypothetical protein [Fructilactobacillus fructivorans]